VVHFTDDDDAPCTLFFTPAGASIFDESSPTALTRSLHAISDEAQPNCSQLARVGHSSEDMDRLTLKLSSASLSAPATSSPHEGLPAMQQITSPPLGPGKASAMDGVAKRTALLRLKTSRSNAQRQRNEDGSTLAAFGNVTMRRAHPREIANRCDFQAPHSETCCAFKFPPELSSARLDLSFIQALSSSYSW
jgi:hypothetical protein